MMTSFIEQMNDLNSLFIEHLETYFGDQTSYRFLSSLDGDISNEIEMESQGERDDTKRVQYDNQGIHDITGLLIMYLVKLLS